MAKRVRQPERLRAIGYVRVSTVEQATEGVSLAAQRAAISAYATLHGLDLGEVIEDAGESGGVPLAERPGGSRLVGMVRAGEVGAVIVAKLDRAWRSAADALATTSEWTERDVALHLIDMKLDTASAFGRMFLTLLAGFAELERNLIGERTAAALAHLRSQGVHVGRDGLGWRRLDALDEHGRRVIVRDEDEAACVERMSELRNSGLTYAAVADSLHTEGWRTKRGGRWASATVQGVLKRRSRPALGGGVRSPAFAA